MSNYFNNTPMNPAAEQKITMDGTQKLVGTLNLNPVKLILNNLSSVSCVVFMSINGIGPLVQFATFSANQAIVIDCDLYSIGIGTTIYATGASGDFSLAYFYTQ